jgi:hypothetical protein
MGAAATLTSRAGESGIEAFPLSPTLGDFNEDLRTLGIEDLLTTLRRQLLPQDIVRFLPLATTDTA